MEFPKCDICGGDVSRENGVLSISFREVREVQQAHQEFDKKHSGCVLHVSDFMTLPERVHWKWAHSKCNSQSSYQIEASRFDMVEKALHWTVHLIDKNWFEFTDWREVIHRFFPECD